MIDEAGFTLYRIRNPRLYVGCDVEVVRGTLAGMTGVLVGYSPGSNCLIRLDCVQRGVMAMIDAGSLLERPPVPVPAPPRPATPFTVTNN
jgi:hypothetical protein